MRSILLAVPLALWLGAPPAVAEDTPPPSITVGGRATLSVVPDTAILTLGVVTDDLRAAAAAAANSRATQAVIETVKAQGIDPRDVQTNAITLAPRFAPNGGETRIVGYRATNRLTIRVRPVAKAADLAGALIDKGVNSIDSIDFSISDADGKLKALRADAMRDAREQAETYVGAIGLKLGRVLRIDPGTSAAPSPPAFRMASAMVARPAPTPVPVEAGSSDLEADVSVTWELAQ